MLRLLLIAMMVVLLSACQSSNPVAQASTSWMGELSPLGSYRVERRHTMILPLDASIYVANPASALLTDDGTDVNTLLAEKLRQGFSLNFSQVYSGVNKERMHQALYSARQLGAQFLVFPQVGQWADIKPIKLKNCEDNPGAEGCDARDGGSEGDSRVSIAIYESVSGALVDLVTVNSQRGITAYLYEDNDKPLELLVSHILDSLTARR